MGIHRYKATKQVDARMLEWLRVSPDAISLMLNRRYPVCNKLIRCGSYYCVEEQGEIALSYYRLLPKDTFRTWDSFQKVTLQDGLDNQFVTSKCLNQQIIAIFNVMAEDLPSFITIHEESSIRFEVDGAGECSAEIEIYGMLGTSQPVGNECDFYEYDHAGDAVMRTV